MGQGKYSPRIPHAGKNYDFKYNCRGVIPCLDRNEKYNEELHFDSHDSEGFDMYGYSALDTDKNFVGCGNGVDRLGYTEEDYRGMTEYEYLAIAS